MHQRMRGKASPLPLLPALAKWRPLVLMRIMLLVWRPLTLQRMLALLAVAERWRELVVMVLQQMQQRRGHSADHNLGLTVGCVRHCFAWALYLFRASMCTTGTADLSSVMHAANLQKTVTALLQSCPLHSVSTSLLGGALIGLSLHQDHMQIA